MPNTLCFFPWLTIPGPLTIGDVRLVPYRRGHLPGNTETATQADIDGILSAYAWRKDNVIERATLLEIGDWRNGQDASDEVDKELFRVREFLAFSAMAHRRLFQREQYSNYDTFALTIQRYTEGSAGTFSFNVRRRDAGVTHLWNAEEFAFLKPLHVESGARLHFDLELFKALRQADEKDLAPFAAIVEYNLANSDGQVPEHTELVMLKSAFEFLLGIDQHADSFADALMPLMPRFDPTEEFKCPEFGRWSQRFLKSTRPIEAWAREFCVQRNEAGHGRRRGGGHHVWSPQAHLAFGSILLPNLVRFQLEQKGFLALTEEQQVEREWIEAYVGFDPLADPPKSGHEWLRIFSDGVVREIRRRRLREALAGLE